jgi:hypothetical protein
MCAFKGMRRKTILAEPTQERERLESTLGYSKADLVQAEKVACQCATAKTFLPL